MKATALLLMSVGLLVGCNSAPSSVSAAHATPTFKLGEIRGDALGIAYSAYKKAHPKECTMLEKGPFCFNSSERYAGINASKSADFNEGKLYRIEYSVDAGNGHELLEALKEKYGEPRISRSDYSSWSDGTGTILYISSEKQASVTFSLPAVDSAIAQKERQLRAQAHKIDQ